MAWARGAATKGGQHVLLMVRSHYPRADVQRFGEGLAADTDDAQVPALLEEVLPLVESMSKKVNLEGCYANEQ